MNVVCSGPSFVKAQCKRSRLGLPDLRDVQLPRCGTLVVVQGKPWTSWTGRASRRRWWCKMFLPLSQWLCQVGSTLGLVISNSWLTLARNVSSECETP